MSSADSRTDRPLFAGITGLTVLAWYALPDVVRSRPARAAVKVGLLGVTALGATRIPQVFPQAAALKDRPALDLPVPALAALAVGGTTALTAATVWGEKALYARGERRRARGVRWAHTPLALAMAAGSAAAVLVDWPNPAAGER